jgi:polysaccharide export outer membrane protein
MKPHFSLRLTTGIGLVLGLVMTLPGAVSSAWAGQKHTSPRTVAEAMNRGAATPTVAPAAAAAPAAGEYVIGAEDVLAIDVWREPEVSRVEPVRPDGKITLPLIGEVRASGLTPKSLQAEITDRLASYIQQPAVTVIVQEARSHRFNIIGEVLRPGSYALGKQMTVLDALAVAGGFRVFAKLTRICIVRRQADGTSLRIRFNYKDAVKGQKRYLNLQLKPGDTVIVP